MRALVLTIVLFLALPASAQDAPGFFSRLFGTDEAASDYDQGSLIERLIQDQLSGEGREVKIRGFSGALSGEARLESLTVADTEGVWLTISDAVLDWNRGALFNSRLEVAELSAAEIRLERFPDAGSNAAPSPEASGFSLPELPVSIAIDKVAGGHVFLGAPILGRPAEVSLEGGLRLEAGEGAAKLAITRLDAEGALRLTASYSNATGILGLDMGLEEGPGGIFATLVGLPGDPPVEFSASGEAPADNFTASVRLATEGTERLVGEIRTSTPENAEPGSYHVAAAIEGDIAPVLAPAYRKFFGDDIRLRAEATRFADGRLVLADLGIVTHEMALEGNAEIGADGLPLEIGIKGTIASGEGVAVLLPLPGTETYVDAADLEVHFDAARSDRWDGRISVDYLKRGDVSAERLLVTGTGLIREGETPQVTADLDFAARGLDPWDPALATAIGRDIAGALTLDWQGGPLRLSKLRVEGRDYRLSGKADFTTSDDGPEIAGTARLEATDLDRFSGLVGRALGGSAALDLTFQSAPLAGTFDVSANGLARDLIVNEPHLDPLLRGGTQLTLAAIRDRDGLRAALERLENPSASITGSADLRSGGSKVGIRGRLADAGLVLDGLQGPATIILAAEEDAGRNWDWSVDAGLESGSLSATGTLDEPFGVPRVSARGTARADDLAPFAPFADRPIGGSFAADFVASAIADFSEAALELTGTGQDLRIGHAEIDRLLAGALSADVKASLLGDAIDIERMELKTGLLDASASGRLNGAESEIAIEARLADVAPFANGFSGPLSLAGTVGQGGDGRYDLNLSATGPGGMRVSAKGTTSPDFGDLDVALSGDAPLALANRFIVPRALSGSAGFDLRLSGPPALTSLSGLISSSGARLADPELGIALEEIQFNARLATASAEISLAARVEQGGRISVTGPVALTPPHQASLALVLDRVALSDPKLYETEVAGRITVEGPLDGGARIAGALTLGATNIRIPSSGLGGAGSIPEVVHLNETPPIRGTLRRAGLLDTNGKNGSGPSYPLDVIISAPNRVFVRGRGLESEFGGGLRLTGTTADTIPSGGFTLIRGRLDILGRRLALEEAVVTVQGTFEPYLNLRASTVAEEYRVGVTVTGPASNPDIAFTSEPELPEEEVLARLIFGRGIETLSPLQAARLALAVRTLAGGGGEGVVGKIRRRSGLADLDVTTGEDGAAAVRAGAYLSEKLYTDVTVGADGESEIRLNLDITPSLTVKSGVRNDGATSLGIFFERDY